MCNQNNNDSLLIQGVLSPNLISRDIHGKKRTRKGFSLTTILMGFLGLLFVADMDTLKRVQIYLTTPVLALSENLVFFFKCNVGLGTDT